MSERTLKGLLFVAPDFSSIQKDQLQEPLEKSLILALAEFGIKRIFNLQVIYSIVQLKK